MGRSAKARTLRLEVMASHVCMQRTIARAQ
jgi:hypothetical protein